MSIFCGCSNLFSTFLCIFQLSLYLLIYISFDCLWFGVGIFVFVMIIICISHTLVLVSHFLLFSIYWINDYIVHDKFFAPTFRFSGIFMYFLCSKKVFATIRSFSMHEFIKILPMFSRLLFSAPVPMEFRISSSFLLSH